MLASCTTFFSVYVSLSKNSFFSACQGVSLKSGCKGTTIFHYRQTFKGKNTLFLEKSFCH